MADDEVVYEQGKWIDLDTIKIYDGTLTAQVIEGPFTGVRGLRVYGGPTDPISDIPVGIDFAHHQLHEGEMHSCFNEQLSIGAGSVNYAIVVPAAIYPHMIVSGDIYGGGAIVRMYKSATYTGGGTLTPYNRNRGSTILPATAVYNGVTSSDGTQIDSFMIGASKSTGGNQRPDNEWILNAATTYRVEVVGLDAGSKGIVRFSWYEDLGV